MILRENIAFEKLSDIIFLYKNKGDKNNGYVKENFPTFIQSN